MSLTKLLNQNLVAVESNISDKNAVLSAIAEMASKQSVLTQVDKKTVFEGLQAREELGSTGFGKGIAIPHCRISGITDFVLGIVSLPNKVDFDSLDGQPVGLVVFLLAPEEQSNKHIRLLSAISQVLRIPGAVDEITAQKSPELIVESFLKFAQDDVDDKTHESKNLFHVVVTNEDVFHDVLPIFSALNGSIEFVLEAKSIGDYTTKVPLFAGILNDDLLSFCRVIVATVEKRMTNETIRRIESITGPLDSSSDVMLIVQDVVYASGNMDS
jgi:PTS system nitrogen regulatory IIA component